MTTHYTTKIAETIICFDPMICLFPSMYAHTVFFLLTQVASSVESKRKAGSSGLGRAGGHQQALESSSGVSTGLRVARGDLSSGS